MIFSLVISRKLAFFPRITNIFLLHNKLSYLNSHKSASATTQTYINKYEEININKFNVKNRLMQEFRNKVV